MCLLARIKFLICKFWTVIEFCERCGRRQPLVWWCISNPLYGEITGKTSGNGAYCPECFDKLASDKGIAIRWLATEEYRFNKKEAANEDV